MLSLSFRAFHIAKRPFLRYAATVQKIKPRTSVNAVRQLENDGSRILHIVRRKLDERSRLLSEISDSQSSREDIDKVRRVKELELLQAAWDEWVHTSQLIRETTALLSDPDPSMRSLASEEYDTLTESLTRMVQTEFPALLIPRSQTTHLSAMIELKSGVGGQEASLFLADLVRVYLRFANFMRWHTQVLASSPTERGGLKDAILEVKGAGSYDSLRWESGVHRVQRVPETEEGGRTHTSTVAVIVLPVEENDNMDDGDGLFSMNDIKIEVMRARGAGGQHVNKTESAVRLTHLPTGITVSMQDERSQHQNKRRAFQVLRARLMDIKLTREMEERRSTRQKIVRTADRSEKVRTYNYSQDRVTDHRIGLSLMNLSAFMEGDSLGTFLDALKRDHEEGLLESLLDDSEQR